MSIQQPGQYRQQDYQTLVRWRPTHDYSHAELRWQQRAPEQYRDLDVRVAWREARPVESRGSSYVRYHESSGMVLFAEYGFLKTVVRAEHATGQAKALAEEDEDDSV